jgi:hypothetical protein
VEEINGVVEEEKLAVELYQLKNRIAPLPDIYGIFP